jgi:hypothetical protein
MTININWVKVWHFIKSVRTVRRSIVSAAIISSIPLAICIDVYIQHASAPIYYTAEVANAQEVEEAEKPVMIEVEIDWSKERVKEEVDKQAKAFHTFAEKMHTTVNCESQYNVKAYNGSDPYGGAIGVAQFLTPTFNKYAPLAGVESPDIHNPEHQLQTMAYMFSIGEASQWTCFRMHYR